jgi:hypothetical protein
VSTTFTQKIRKFSKIFWRGFIPLKVIDFSQVRLNCIGHFSTYNPPQKIFLFFPKMAENRGIPPATGGFLAFFMPQTK